jgi:hypothetical protein
VRVADKGFDQQIGLYPADECLDLPAFFVDIGNGFFQ